MPQLTAPQETKLRAEKHKLTPYLSILKHRVLWSALVNSDALAQGDVSIPFDGGSGLNFSWVEPVQEVWVGTSAGADDLGRARIKGISSGDGGITGTLTVAKSPITWQNNAHLTFIHDYPVKPKRPRIATDETFYKDYDIAFDWPPTPVCIAGPDRAEFLEGASLVFNVDLSLSYPVASGASIASSFAASVVPSAGVTVAVSAATGIGTITFTQTGQYWAKFSCTDDNGKTQVTYRWYDIASPDPTSEDYPVVVSEIPDITHAWASGGWECSFSVHESATLSDIPDKTAAILWGRWTYDGVDGPISFAPDSSSIVMGGFIRQDSFSKSMADGEAPVRFKMSTAHGVLGQKYNFSVSLEAVNATPDVWWKYDSSLTVGRGVHHLLAEHTTALERMDVFGLTNITTKRAYVEIPDNNLFGAASSLSNNRGTREHLVCDIMGRMHLVPNPQFLSDADRAGLTTTAAVTATDRSLLEIDREQENQVCLTYVSGFVWDGTFDENGAPDAQSVCAIAPGDDAEDDGPQVERMDYQTFASQQEANDVAGRVHSARNNAYKSIEVAFQGNYLGVLDSAYGEQWEISLLTTETPREIVLTNRPIYPRVVQASVLDGVVTIIATFEAEAPSLQGKFTNCPVLPPLGGDSPDIPDEDDLGGGLLSAGSVKYKSPLGNSWATRYAGAVSDMAIDPYWNSKQDSTASEDAIVVIGGVGYLRRSTDAGKNWSVITPGTDPPNDAGDDPAPTAATVDYNIIEASQAVESEWVVIARWQNGDGDWRSWFLYTDDDFATSSWSSAGGGYTELAIPSSYDAGELHNTHADYQQILDMGNDRLVAMWISLGSVGQAHTRVALIDTANGTVLEVGGSGGSLGTRVMAIAKLTDTTFAAIQEVTDSYVLVARVYDISGDEASSWVGEGEIPDHLGISDMPTVVSIARLSDTTFIAAYNVDEDGNDNGMVVHCTFDEVDTITFGTPVVFHSGAVNYFVLLEGLVGTHLYYQDDSLTDLRGAMITASGTVLTVFSSVAVLANSVELISACILTGDKAVVVYADTADSNHLWSRVVTLGTGTAVMGTDYEIKNAVVTAVYAAETGASSGVVAYRHGTSTLSYTRFTVDGHVLTPGSEVDYPITGFLPLITNTPKGLVYVGADENNDDRVTFYLPGIGGGSAKILGLSLGKAEGFLAYITLWDGVELAIRVYELPSVALLDDIYLGDATEDELDNREKIAFPYSPWGFSDDFVWVYGRMFNPAGLSGLSHIIYSLDGALTFALLDDSLGAYHVSSLTEQYGTVQAMVSLLNQSKLYTGNLSGIQLRSTLPISGYINPHGTTYDWLEQVIYAASGVAGAVVVVKSSLPYDVWTDITYDHGATAVRSLEIL
jgi:hypothetical protein